MQRESIQIWHAIQRRKATADCLRSLSSDHLDVVDAAEASQSAATARAAAAVLRPTTPSVRGGSEISTPFGRAPSGTAKAETVVTGAQGARPPTPRPPMRQQSLPSRMPCGDLQTCSLRSCLKKTGSSIFAGGSSEEEARDEGGGSSSDYDDGVRTPAITTPKRVSFCDERTACSGSGHTPQGGQPVQGSSAAALAAGGSLPCPPALQVRTAVEPRPARSSSSRSRQAALTTDATQGGSPRTPWRPQLTRSASSGGSPSPRRPAAAPVGQPSILVAGSPNTRWITAYGTRASQFTQSGSGRSEPGSGSTTALPAPASRGWGRLATPPRTS